MQLEKIEQQVQSEHILSLHRHNNKLDLPTFVMMYPIQDYKRVQLDLRLSLSDLKLVFLVFFVKSRSIRKITVNSGHRVEYVDSIFLLPDVLGPNG